MTVDEDTKSRLEELRDEIRAGTRGQSRSRRYLGELIDDAYEETDETVDTFRESTVPLSKAETEAMSRGRLYPNLDTLVDKGSSIKANSTSASATTRSPAAAAASGNSSTSTWKSK